MLILPESHGKAMLAEVKAGITKQFNEQLEAVLNRCSSKDSYFILGKLRRDPNLEVSVYHVFLQECDERPPFVTDTFVYQVNNRSGTKELLWTVDKNGNIHHVPTAKRITPIKSTGVSQPSPGMLLGV